MSFHLDSCASPSVILKVGAGQSEAWSVFNAGVTPDCDVARHLHHHAELAEVW